VRWTTTSSPTSLRSFFRSFALTESMCPPAPVGSSPAVTGSPSTVATTFTDLPVPNSSIEPGTSTHDQRSPFTVTPIGAVKRTSNGPGLVLTVFSSSVDSNADLP